MKLIYAGAPAFSVPPLAALRKAGFEVLAVLTQPDKPVGRKAVLTPTPLKAYALQEGIPVLEFARVRDNVPALAAQGADILVTCAYGQILTQEVLDAFPAGVYNIHASLLPRWRGASPIQHAILEGDSVTGVTIMRTDIGLDTGDVLLQKELPIEQGETAETLSQKLSELGAEAAAEALRLLERGAAQFTKQPQEGVTLCKKIRKEDCEVHFSQSAQTLSCLIRAMNPQPLAFSRLHGKLVNFYYAEAAAETGDGVCGQVVRADKTGIYVQAGEGCLRILQMQAEGGKRMSAADFVNGRKVCVGDIFGG